MKLFDTREEAEEICERVKEGEFGKWSYAEVHDKTDRGNLVGYYVTAAHPDDDSRQAGMIVVFCEDGGIGVHGT